MRRLASRTAAALVLAAFVTPAAAGTTPPSSWAQLQIAAVLEAGVMSGGLESFRPDDPITQTELDGLIGNLTQQPVEAGAVDLPVTMAELDLRLVDGLGLAPAAQAFGDEARAAGLQVPDRFGSEVVARLLGLRTNHPAKQDALELLPDDPATRAEAAYSAARILSFSGEETRWVQDTAATFTLPALTAWQQRILTTALAFVGYPYVWGGTSEGQESLFGVDSRGGFDCSGFVWRVYKLQRYAGEGALASTLTGRTTVQMSREVPRSQRILLPDLQPGDVLFFGAKGPRSRPAQVNHAGIYLGNGWFVHSSRYGVALAPLAGWYRDSFAWARRPLAEAGLSA